MIAESICPFFRRLVFVRLPILHTVPGVMHNTEGGSTCLEAVESVKMGGREHWEENFMQTCYVDEITFVRPAWK